jgi:predicted GH43/DUF377 family glycosyl hydrolase
MEDFHLRRQGMVMEPEPGNPNEVEGVLNPAAARGPDGKLYLFPRLVAKGNYSRIGIARVRFNDAGDPIGVERVGIALQPEAEYERRPDGGGGCEDPRVTYVEPLQCYIMSYTAFSPAGPRIAFAKSDNLLEWERLGLATYAHWHGIELGNIDDKDACLFPVAIPNSSAQLELGMLHRPLFPGTRPEEIVTVKGKRLPDIEKESIWISYCGGASKDREYLRLCQFTSHHRLATPDSPWERLKIGCGTPPILTRHGWLILYHGVSESKGTGVAGRQLCYSAGVMVLSTKHPRVIRYRSAQPVLTPVLPQEQHGTIANVVFPTGIDRRDDLGTPDRFDVYYGMADRSIGVARLDVPDRLPVGADTDTHALEGMV